jgi:kanamycin kinase
VAPPVVDESGWSVAGEPEATVAVPAAVTRLAGSRKPRPVWRNELGGLTFELPGAPRLFVKWAPADSGIDLDDERLRLAWSSRFTCVPEVLSSGADHEGSWLVTRAVAGESAVSPRWVGEPVVAVGAIGEGLRALHDRLPVADCPFSWSAGVRLERARGAAEHGLIDPMRWHPSHRRLSVEEALDLARDEPPVDRLVVCHGDACAPNTLITEDGRWSGHVDLGSLGVADRWADLAIATWSTEWNYGPGFEGLLLDAYGVERVERIRYYRLLWDLGC